MFHHLILILFAVFTASNQLEVSLAVDDSFYENPTYKQSVAFEAPIIDAKETLSLLRQLRYLIPQEEKAMASELDRLIDVSEYKSTDTCERHYIGLPLYLAESKNTLSSKGKNKTYGSNVVAYIEHYVEEAVEYCANLLRQSVKRIPSADQDAVDELSRKISPGSIKSYNALSELYEDYGKLQSGLVKYLDNKISEAGASSLKKTFHQKKLRVEQLNLLIDSCKNFNTRAEPADFIEECLKHSAVESKVAYDSFLMDLAIKKQICRAMINKMDSSSLEDLSSNDDDEDSEKSSSHHSFFGHHHHHHHYGGSSGSYDPGYTSSASFGMANIS